MIGRSVAIVALAVVWVSACSGDASAPTNPGVRFESQAVNAIYRPLTFSQAWDAAGNDFTNPCIAQVPTGPGTFIQVPFPGFTSGRGIGTHLGLHTVRIYTATCSWDNAVAAISASGPWVIQAANGDTVRGTYAGYWNLITRSFSGEVFVAGGTGRFAGASGWASMEAHDAADWSGWDKGVGWIAY